MNRCMYCYIEHNVLYPTKCNNRHLVCSTCYEKNEFKCIICYPYICAICNEFYKYKDIKNDYCQLTSNKHYICNICLKYSLGVCMLCSPLETTSTIIVQKEKVIKEFTTNYILDSKEKSGKFNCNNCGINRYKYDFNVEYNIINKKIHLLVYPIYQFIESNDSLFCLDCEKTYCHYCSDIIPFAYAAKNNVICINCITMINNIKNSTNYSLDYILENISQCYYCFEYRTSKDPDVEIKRVTNNIQLTLDGICKTCANINKERGYCECGNVCLFNKIYCFLCADKYCIIDDCDELIAFNKYCKLHIKLKCSVISCCHKKMFNYKYCVNHIKKCVIKNCYNLCSINTSMLCDVCIVRYNQNILYTKCIRCNKNIKYNINYKGKTILCIECRHNGKDLSMTN